MTAMDQIFESLSARISATNEANKFLGPQTSSFEQLVRDHNAERTRLDDEYKTRKAEIHASLRQEHDRFISTLVEGLNSTIEKRVSLRLEEHELDRASEDRKRRAAESVLKLVTDLICNPRPKQNMASGSDPLDRLSTSPTVVATIDGSPGTLHQTPLPNDSNTPFPNREFRVTTRQRSPAPPRLVPTPAGESSCSAQHPREQPIPDDRASQQTPATGATPTTVKRRRPNLEYASATKRRRVKNSAAPQASSANSVERKTDREITFQQVFQGGQAKYKHKIFELDEGSGDWYIVKCDEHEVHFGSKIPVRGAAKHINSPQHSNLERTNDLAIQECGFLVTDCTAELARENNKNFEDALKQGYNILRPSKNKDPNSPRSGPSGKMQVKPRKTKPEDTHVPAAEEFGDQGRHNLPTCVESNGEVSDCIIIPSASEPRMDVEVAFEDERNNKDSGALHEDSASNYDLVPPDSEKASTGKQDADHGFGDCAITLQCSDTEGVICINGGTPPRHPGITEGVGNLAAASALLQLRGGLIS
ncbi:hypothetical protein F5883DRAFT_125783 [Diaporthe sp. PMI_573]|nr:hypothetical protein F5883DRAFT_125783 [Diaporthaceae sp. PMI_573]